MTPGLPLRVGLLILVMLLGSARAAPVTLNLKDADIGALIASIAEITGKNFIIDPRVQGRVTVVSARPLEEDEVYEVFLSILAVHGYAAVPGERAIKIVPVTGAKQEQIPNLGSDGIGGDDQMVTQVIQVRNVAAAQLVPLLRPLIPPDGHLAAYAPSNVLVVSDRAGNVRRVAELIGRMDQASGAEIEVVPLAHARAGELANLLGNLIGGQAQDEGSASPPRLAADERSNSILLSGDSEARQRLRGLIRELDTPLASSGNTRVVYLRYARAEDLLPVLQGLSRKLEADASEVVAAAAEAGRIDIQADPATNALVITAEPDAMLSLQSVIDRLDIRRAQVMVEAAIVEISSDRIAELGVQWLIDGSGDGNIVGLTNFESASFNGLSIGELARAIASETLPSPFPSGLSALIGDFTGSTRFGALISALATDANTNILSTPTLVTLDNEEAEIIVGQNVPFVTGTFTTTTGGSGDVGNPFQTIERQDVGLTLQIKPQINEGNAVLLQIGQEVSQVVQTATTLTLAQGPTTNKRSLKTSVLVEDGQILVLGGLIDDTLSETMQKVPGLGDLPVLGNLFRYRQTSRGKRNLMIFLHPVILRDAVISSTASTAKYEAIRDMQGSARERGVSLLPDEETPLLTRPDEVRDRGSLDPVAPPPPPPTAGPPLPDTPSLNGFGNK
jgi:general secretion pathway protein D